MIVCVRVQQCGEQYSFLQLIRSPDGAPRPWAREMEREEETCTIMCVPSKYKFRQLHN